jgi:hypothetical protein
MILGLIVLLVTAILSRGGHHPRLLRGGIAYAATSFVLVLAVLSMPRVTMTSGEAYGIPLAVALVVALVPWARLVPLMKYPGAVGVVVAWVIALCTFAYPVPIYMTWRYATGHRPSERDVSAAASAEPTAPAALNAPTETKVCPDCAEQVLAAARICRFCRHEFPAPADDASAPVVVADLEPASVAVPMSSEPDLAIAPTAPEASAMVESPSVSAQPARVGPRLLLPALLIAAIACVALAGVAIFAGGGKAAAVAPAPTPAPSTTPAPAITVGSIDFGTGEGPPSTCSITGPTDHYKAGDALYWAASFSRMVEASEPTKVRLYVDGAPVVTGAITPARGSCVRGSVGQDTAFAGHYLLEYLVGTEVLARGEVDVLPK